MPAEDCDGLVDLVELVDQSLVLSLSSGSVKSHACFSDPLIKSLLFIRQIASDLIYLVLLQPDGSLGSLVQLDLFLKCLLLKFRIFFELQQVVRQVASFNHCLLFLDV